MKVQSRIEELRAAEIRVVVVGFSPMERLEFILGEFELTFPLISDPERPWYRAFEIGSGGWGTVFAPRILWSYVRLMTKGSGCNGPMMTSVSLAAMSCYAGTWWRPAGPAPRASGGPPWTR